MHAAIRRYNMFPSAIETIRTRVNDELLPTMRQLPGFIAYYVVDGGDGTLIAVSVFEERATAEESTRQATAWARERLSHLVRTAPVISTGEVIAHGEGAAVR
jgi:quinol monooxygenase YgiN